MSYKFLVVGAGEGGGRIADKFAEMKFCHRAVAINTSEPDLDGLQHIPQSNQLKIFTPMHIAGAGKNPDMGEQAARNNADTITAFLRWHCLAEWAKDKDEQRAARCDFILVAVGGGGGTGTGLAVPLTEMCVKLGLPVGMIYTLPVGKSDGTVTLINALTLLKPLHALAEAGTISPFILVDNEKLLSECGSNITDYWGAVNLRICQPLHVINVYSDRASKYVSALDTADLGTLLLSGGCCSLNTFTVANFDRIDAAREVLHRGYFLNGFDLRTAKAAGLIVVGKANILAKPEATTIYEALNKEVADCLSGGLIYKGLYEDDRLDHAMRIVTVFNGMALPTERLDEMLAEMGRGMSAMEGKERRVGSFDFSFGSKTALRAPGMDRLSKKLTGRND